MKELNFSCNKTLLSLLGCKNFCACLMQTKVLTTLGFPENLSLFTAWPQNISFLLWSLSLILLSFAAKCHSRYLITSTEKIIIMTSTEQAFIKQNRSQRSTTGSMEMRAVSTHTAECVLAGSQPCPRSPVLRHCQLLSSSLLIPDFAFFLRSLPRKFPNSPSLTSDIPSTFPEPMSSVTSLGL